MTIAPNLGRLIFYGHVHRLECKDLSHALVGHMVLLIVIVMKRIYGIHLTSVTVPPILSMILQLLSLMWKTANCP